MDVYTHAATSTPATTVVAAQGLLRLTVVGIGSGHAADQAWFWTPEWQEGELEVDEHIAAGRSRHFGSTEEFLAALEREIG
jgi:hypothetical protein